MKRRLFLGTVGAATVLAAAPAWASPGERVVFLGSYTSSGGDGLDVAAAEDPGLRAGHAVPGVPDASWLALSADRSVLYATNEDDTGAVTALSVKGEPRVLNTQPTLGSGPTHLSIHPSGRYLLTANYNSGSVVVHPILPGGALGEATDLVVHKASTGDAHAHQMVTDPTGQWVLSVDLGADSVYVYRLAGGKLALHQQLVLPPGTGPRHLAFHPLGNLAYLACEVTPVVTVLAWDSVRGLLKAGDVVPAAGDSPGPNYPGEIAVSRDGRFVYVSVRGENTIATFVARGRGLTRLGQNVPTGGDWPRHFALDGRWMYVSNQRSGTVTWLPVDPVSGLPGAVAGSLSVPAVAMVLFDQADQSGS